jgi:hypothetical protein
MTTFEHAKQYLARVLPWPQANEAPAWVNIHWTFKKPDMDRAMWGGKAVKSVHEAAKAIEFALKLPDTQDIYVCMSTQREANEKVSQKGFTYHTPIRNQANAVALKAVFLDIDVKGGANGYSNLTDAVLALEGFLAQTGLPKPSVLVASGGGLHVYWTFDRALMPPEWHPLALALAEATKVHGLKCDTQCTIDSARVLRVPDTFNRKSSPPRPVKLLKPGQGHDYTVERIAKALNQYRTTDDPDLPPRTPITGESELAMGIEQGRSAPANIENVAKECAFVRDAIARGGLDYTNPMWNLTTLISVFCDNGRAAAHKMGAKHPGYSVESTDQLYDRKEKEVAAKGLGWPACKTISGSGCTACQSCKHFPEGKSPLHFGRDVTPTVTTPPIPAVIQHDLPKGYVRGVDGTISAQVMTPDGQTEYSQISPYRMERPWLQKNPRMLHFTSTVDLGQDEMISIPLGIIGGMEMRKHLQDQGFMLPTTSKELGAVTRFFKSWTEKLQASKESVKSCSFGWHVDKGDVAGFVYDGQLWTPNGSSPAACPDPSLARHYAPSGNPGKWEDACKLITDQKRPALEAIVASAFAGPLIRMVGREGCIMSTYSTDSGIGKTTSMIIAQAVWGDPVRGKQGLNDTQNYVMGKLGQLNSIPLYWDEIKTHENVKKFVDLTFTVTGGREKGRMNRNIQLREPGVWQTLVVSASNESILDYVLQGTKTTAAGVLRIFEYVVPPAASSLGQIDSSVASRQVAALNDHYGNVGLRYAKWLGANYARCDKEVAAYIEDLNTTVSADREERYWISVIAVICMGARYANDLGVAEFDEDALRAFLLDELARMRQQRKDQPVDMTKDTNISTVLAQMLNQWRARNTLKTNRIHVGRGKPAHGQIQVLNSDQSRLDQIHVHVGMEDKILRISSYALTQWLTERGYSRHTFIGALQKQLGMKLVNGRLGSGTSFAGATEYLVEIQLAGTPVVNFIDEA